jgi:hypothetical protein
VKRLSLQAPGLAAVALALAAAAPAPTYVVERVTTVGESTRRVSVFRDGTAVLAVREGLGEPVVIRHALAPIELQVVIQVVEECYEELRALRPPSYAPGGAWIELRLAPAGREPAIVRLPVAGTPHSEVVRIAQALDGIENRLKDYPGEREDLSQWMPQRGERVRLVDGRVVDVTSVTDSNIGPLIAVRVVDNPVGQVLTLDEIRKLAAARVKR